MKKLVMCPPYYFDVVYELSTNRWMKKDERPDKQQAYEQWLSLFLQCRDFAEVCLAEAVPGLPDLTFMANAGISYKKAFILSNFYHEERRRENSVNSRFFKQMFSEKDIWTLDNDAYFEGQGDAVWLNDKQLVIGYGIRTNLKGVKEVERVLYEYDKSVEVIPIPMEKQTTFYHLDTCLFYMPNSNAFMLYRGAFTSEGLARLGKIGKILPVTESEAKKFVCNSVVMNQETIFTPWANDSIKDLLAANGYKDVRIFPMSEFLKSGGAVKCLILEI